MYIVYSIIIMAAMSLLLGVMIAIFARVFEVKEDPRIAQLIGVLPAYNCGSCGYPGCSQYAAALVAGHVPDNKCTPGGSTITEKVRAIMNAPAA